MQDLKVKKGNIAGSIFCLILGIILTALGIYLLFDRTAVFISAVDPFDFLILSGGITLFLIALPDLFPSTTYPNLKIQFNDKFRHYLLELPVMGLLPLPFSIFMATIIFSDKHPETWSIYYLPFKLIAVLFVLWYEFRVFRGGLPISYTANNRGREYVPDKDEELFNQLIIHFKSKKVIFLMAGLYLVSDIVIGRNLYNFSPVSFDGVFGHIVLTGMIVGAASLGLKYLSTWWNLRSAFQVSPERIQKIMNTKYEPVFPPKIDIVKLIKNSFKQIKH